jgi:excinuclease ABC subunit C
MRKGKLDFNRQIGLYPGEGDKKQYAATIRHIRMFFEGKKERIIKELERAMYACARTHEFERAHELKKKIFALRHIQDVALLKDEARSYKDDRSYRIEAYDIAHLSGKAMVGVMTVVVGNAPHSSEYRKFTIRSTETPDDPRALAETLERRLRHSEWQYPELIVADGGVAQVRALERVLHKMGHRIPVVGVVKDERHKPKNILGAKDLITAHKAEILLANAEAHRFAIAFHRAQRTKRMLG